MKWREGDKEGGHQKRPGRVSRGETELVRAHSEWIIRGNWSPASGDRFQAGHDDNVDDKAQQDVYFNLVQRGLIKHPTEGEPAHEPDDSVAGDLEGKGWD